ncbi:hypothetical protein [Cecembia lonarensis]|nr:hypothetical protein [Cecembia lonarensis]
MKILLSFILILGVAFAASAENDRPNEVAVSVKMVDQSKALFRYKAEPEGRVMVRILDENNKLVKRHTLSKSNAFAKYYDFSNLEPGTYTIEVFENQVQIDRLTVNYSSQEVNDPVAFAKVDKTGSNAFRLLVNSLLPSDFNVQVFENGLLIHEEKVADVTGLERKYRFAGVSPMARVSFLVTNDAGFSQWVNVR